MGRWVPNLILEVDSVPGHDYGALDSGSDVDVITEELVGLEEHRSSHDLPLVDSERLPEQHAALVPVGARRLR